MALLNIRATPLDATIPSPAELIFDRPIPTMLPSHTNQMAPEIYREHVQELSGKQKAHADQHKLPLPPLLVGSPVRVLNKETKTWFKGTVTTNHNNKSYQMLTEWGRTTTRNCHHLCEIPPSQNDTRGPNEPTAKRPPMTMAAAKPSNNANGACASHGTEAPVNWCYKQNDNHGPSSIHNILSYMILLKCKLMLCIT